MALNQSVSSTTDTDGRNMVLGCLQDGDKIWHRSEADSWNKAAYGVLPYERLVGVTPDNILEKTHLDWTVVKTPAYAKIAMSEVPMNDRFATVRLNKDGSTVYLGDVGPDYQVFQNDDLFEVTRPFMEDEDLCLESGGMFVDGKGARQGHKVYLQFKLPTWITVKGDESEQMLFVSTSHDGSMNLKVGLTTIRTICRNTFQMNLDNAQVKIRHSGNLVDKAKNAHETLAIVNEYSKQMNELFNRMADTKVSDKKVKEILALTATADNQTQGLLKKLRSGETTVDKMEPSSKMKGILDDLQGWVAKEYDSHPALKGNAYGLLNGITAYYNHGYNHRKNDKFGNVVFGTPADKMAKAFKLITSEFKLA